MPKSETPKKPQKKYYTVEVECLIPATIKYRVLVDEDNYELAVKESMKVNPVGPPKLQLGKMKRLSAKIYEYGTTFLKYIKHF